MVTEKPITDKQRKYASARAQGLPIMLAAQEAGITPTTARTWDTQAWLPRVQKEMSQASLDASLGLLTTHALQCINTLVSIRDDTAVEASTRMRSAQVLLELSIEVGKSTELEKKMAALEAQLKGVM
jgi:hypothetical protein